MWLGETGEASGVRPASRNEATIFETGRVPRRLAFLLAGVSAFAIAGAANAACVFDPATPFTNTTTIDCLQFDDGATHTGNVTNASTGVIDNSSGDAVHVTGVSVVGSIVNNGNITAAGAPLAKGIELSTATVTVSLVNTGNITGTAQAIQLENSSIGAGIINSGNLVTAQDVGGGIDVLSFDSSSDASKNVTVVNGGIHNTATGNISAAIGILLDGASANSVGVIVNGGILNDGNISGNLVGVYLDGAAGNLSAGATTLNGGITNNGVIFGNEVGVGVVGANLNGNLTNTNTIGGVIGGIQVADAQVTGNINNSGTVGATSGTGIIVEATSITQLSNVGTSTISANALLQGSVNNSGTVIIAQGQDGIQVVGSDSVTVTVTGNIVNSGNIGGLTGGTNSVGIAINDAATVQGGVDNSGELLTTFGMVVNGATVDQGVHNLSTGLVQGGTNGVGIDILGGASVGGGVDNAGTFNATFGILVGGSSVTGGVVNSGVMNGGSTGVGIELFNNGSVTGGITNSGNMTGANGIVVNSGGTVQGGVLNSGFMQGVGTGSVGIEVINGASVSGGIKNTGTLADGVGILVNGGTVTGGIDVSGAKSFTGIELAGNITGNVTLSGHGDAVVLFGGTLNGSVNGNSAVNGANAGTLDIEMGSGTFTTQGTFDVAFFNILSGTLTLANNVTVFDTFTNEGVLQLQGANTYTITGGSSAVTYDQRASGDLLIAVTPTASSVLDVVGKANLDGTVTFAYAPGTYTAKTYTFLESTGLTGQFATVAAGAGNLAVPSGFNQNVSYGADDASLVLASTASPPPPPASPPPSPPPPPASPPPSPPPPPASPPPSPPPPPASPPPSPPPPPASPPPSPPPPPASPPPPPPPPPASPPPSPPPPPASPPPSPPPPPASPPPSPPPPPPPPPESPPPPPASPPPPPESPPPPPAVIIAPTDATIFSNESFALIEENQTLVLDLLGRAAPGDHDSSAHGWITGIGSVLDPGAPIHFRVNSGGIEGGGDIALGGARVGAAIGYESGHYSDSAGGTAGQGDIRVSLYAAQTFGPVSLSGVVGFSHASQTFARQSGLGPSTSSRGVDETDAALQAALPLESGGAKITPSAGVLFTYASAAPFVENNASNPAFAVTGSGARQSLVSPYARIEVSKDFATSGGVAITPSAVAGYRYDDAARGLSQTLIASDGTVFVGNRAGLSPSSALLGAGLAAHKDRWTGFVSYRAAVASNWSNQSVQAGFRFTF